MPVVEEFADWIQRRSIGGIAGPMAPGPRNDLDSSLRSHTANKTFTKALFAINRSLEMAGDRTLDHASSARYQNLAQEVEHGVVSNSYAFGSSAIHWLRQRNYKGAALNAVATLGVGVIDADARKRGR